MDVKWYIQTPLKSWLFQASIRNCFNCVHNCDDHGLLDFKSAVQYMKHFIYLQILNIQFNLYHIRHVKSSTTESEKEIVVDYQDAHARTRHMGKKVKFTICRAPNQSQLRFTGGDETITNKINAVKLTPKTSAQIFRMTSKWKRQLFLLSFKVFLSSYDRLICLKPWFSHIYLAAFNE